MPPPSGLVHDVAHDQEVAGEVLLLDDVELACESFAHVIGHSRVELGGALPGELAQPAHRRVPFRHLLPGQLGAGAAQGEGELVGERHRPRDGAGVTGEAGGHLGAAAQVQPVGRGKPSVELVEAAPRTHRGEGRREPVLGRGRVVHGVRREQRAAASARRGPRARRWPAGRSDVRGRRARPPRSRGRRGRPGGRVRVQQPRARRERGRGARRPCGIRSARPTRRPPARRALRASTPAAPSHRRRAARR